MKKTWVKPEVLVINALKLSEEINLLACSNLVSGRSLCTIWSGK